MGRQDSHSQVFPILKSPPTLLKPNQACLWTMHSQLLVSVFLCLALPELAPRFIWHVVKSSHAWGPTRAHVCILDSPQSNPAKPLQCISKGGAWATFPFFSMLRTQCHQKDNMNLLFGDRKLQVCINCACFEIMNHWRSSCITDPCAWEKHIICHENLGGVQVREAEKGREETEVTRWWSTDYS